LVWRVGSLGFPWIVLFPLAVVGLFVAWRVPEKQLGRRADARLLRFLSWFALALAAGPLLFFVTARYRVPLLPMVAIFAALGAYWLRTRSQRSLWIAAAVALGLAAWPLELPVLRVDYDAELAYLIAGTRQRRGDLDGAERSLEAALRARPDYLEAAVNLALLKKQAGDLDAARRWLEHALSHHPGHPMVQAALRDLGS
jgi:tetratricopeptide (TPR) repeat protein